MMVSERLEESMLSCFLLSAGSCFVLVVALVTCATRSNSKSNNDGTSTAVYSEPHPVNEETIVIPVDALEVQSSNDATTCSNEINQSIETNSSPHRRAFSCEITLHDYEHYNPECSSHSFPRKQPKHQSLHLPRSSLEDAYETIGKTVNTNSSTYIVTIEASMNNSGSGNSDSGGGVYASVKNVPKPEENAYLVVNINEPSEQYDVVAGDIVRKLPTPSTLDVLELPSDKLPKTPSMLSELYAKPDIGFVKKQETCEQENSGSSGYYASVSDNAKPVNEVPQENSGNSEYYASCGPQVELALSQYKPVLNSTLQNNNDAYEIIETKTSLHTYDMIDNHAGDVKSEEENKSKSKEDKKFKRNASKDTIDVGKIRNLKKEKQLKNVNSEKSPKHSSRFSRVNPFKHSKKRHQSDCNITVDASLHNKDESEEMGSLPSSEKCLYLPKQQTQSLPRDLSDPLNPPPLPSVDRLIDITEHRKAMMSGCDGFSSGESSPRNSPTESAMFSKESPASQLLSDKTNEKYEQVHEQNFDSLSSPVHKQIVHSAQESIRMETIVHSAQKSIHTETIAQKTNDTNNIAKETVDSIADHDYADLSWDKNNGVISNEKVVDMLDPMNDNEVKTEPKQYEIVHNKNKQVRDDGQKSVIGVDKQVREDGQKSVIGVDKQARDDGQKSVIGVDKQARDDGQKSVIEMDKEEVGYAIVDMQKKREDRDIKSLYAVVDTSCKKRNVKAEFINNSVPMYEGRYSIIPGVETNGNVLEIVNGSTEVSTSENNEVSANHDYECLSPKTLNEAREGRLGARFFLAEV